MNNNHVFMIPEQYRHIYRTKKDAVIKTSYEKGFNGDHIIDKAHLDKIFCINSAREEVEHYPFLILGESIKCFFSPEIAQMVREPGDSDEELFLMATPICFYFENINAWIYTAANEWNEQIEKTTDLFPVISVGSIYKMTKKSTSDELGQKHKSEFAIPKDNMLFNTEEQLIEYHSSKPANRNGDIFKENVNFLRLENWDIEFMVLSLGKPFICKSLNYDQLKTTDRGGVKIQPIQIIGIDKEVIGWLPMTVSRIKYGIELVKEP